MARKKTAPEAPAEAVESALLASFTSALEAENETRTRDAVELDDVDDE